MVKTAAVITASVVFLIVLITLIIGKSTSEKKEGAQSVLYKLRSIYFYFLIIAIVGLLYITLDPKGIPYPEIKTENPDLIVNVTGRTWAWELSTEKVPVNKLIEFDVKSDDVTHGFGLYSPEGKILAQVQVMPGYTNRLKYRFEHPGEYQVICMELCGVSHHKMMHSLTVEETDSSNTGVKK